MISTSKLVFIIVLIMTLYSCKKDKGTTAPIESLCASGFTQTAISFSALDLSQVNNPDIYSISLNVADDVDGKSYDINCDGTADIIFSASSDQDWFGQTVIKYGRLYIQTLNANTFILADSIRDSTFYVSSFDTIGINISEYQLVSSYAISGSILQQVNRNEYVTHYDSLGVLFANDPRWKSGSQIIRDHYKRASSYFFGPDSSGYNHDILSENEYLLGIVPNMTVSYIPVKYVSNAGIVKLGYFKVHPGALFGFATIGLAGWAIQL